MVPIKNTILVEKSVKKALTKMTRKMALGSTMMPLASSLLKLSMREATVSRL